MIKLKPSKSIESTIDFGLLSNILSVVFPTKTLVSLKVEKSRNKNDFSSIHWDVRTIRILCRDENVTLRYVVLVLLHELRHYFQTRANKKLTYNYSSYREYYNSPEEKDARKAEKLATEVCSIYKLYKRIEEKKAQLELNTFEGTSV